MAKEYQELRVIIEELGDLLTWFLGSLLLSFAGVGLNFPRLQVLQSTYKFRTILKDINATGK